MTAESIRAIAFYLPQFHPIPENDEWWGKGFTEWTNVTKAKPLFKGHYQPHLPADLGFYDLRVPEVREQQAALARQYGIYGFCYYHYWFNGRQLLERPFNEVLASGKPDFPFCLCWANENWTRRWDGQEREILIQQKYSEEDDLNHIRWLARAFSDPRYIRVENRPLFLVYRLSSLPNPAATVARWRSEARRLAVGELFLCNVESFPEEHGIAPQYGLDAAVEFAPDCLASPPLLGRDRWSRLVRIFHLFSSAAFDNCFVDYTIYAKNMVSKPKPDYRRFHCVTPNWDNTARRRQGAVVLQGSTPEAYELWLSTILRRVRECPEPDRVVFLNAWNEWAEGNHLEPCQRWGHAYLEATNRALRNISK